MVKPLILVTMGTNDYPFTRLYEYIKNDPLYHERSALVISHCGIGSLNLMLKYRKRVIFVPRVQQHGEFSDDHQLQIAAELTNKRMQVVRPEDNFPQLDYQQILADNVLAEPVDITNYELARIVNLKLTG